MNVDNSATEYDFAERMKCIELSTSYIKNVIYVNEQKCRFITT
jgi:hypothetical protein